MNSEPDTIRVLGISGSLRAASTNTKLLYAAAGLVGSRMRLELWHDLGLVPPFNEDDEHVAPQAVRALRLAISQADALLIATPEYNSSVPGQLKNAVDWASRPYGASVLRAKPVAVVGASPSAYGAARAQAELRKVLTTAGAQVLDRELRVPRVHEAFGPEGQLLDPELQSDLQEVLADLEQTLRAIPA
ncbi:MAG: NADPH-dependent FMN reductase, partial [Pseudonocardiaceae bacterium]